MPVPRIDTIDTHNHFKGKVREEDYINWILEQVGEQEEFGIQELTLPGWLPDVTSDLHSGVGVDEIVWAKRPNRQELSRCVRREPVPSRQVVVIWGPSGIPGDLVVYTIYGGELAPREPWDESLKTDAEKAESKEFWATHALSLQPDFEVEAPSQRTCLYCGHTALIEEFVGHNCPWCGGN